jgi:hypothetical protein
VRDEVDALLAENRRLRKEVRRLGDRIDSFERSRWWRLHPRLLARSRPVTTPHAAEDAGFDPGSYATLREGSVSSSVAVVPILHEIVQPTSVIDAGGGEGWWARAFARLGVRAVSIDNGEPGEPAEGVEHVRHDLSRGLPADLGHFDLALCLEVVEHLDPVAGETLVDALCSRTPTVVFSAAIPGQGGHGHVNEQWPAYWAERFERNGFRCSGALRFRLWHDERIEPWYRQNLLFATNDASRYPELFETPLSEPWPLVHPATFARAVDSVSSRKLSVDATGLER